MPATSPVTVPVEPTVAFALLLPQVPPVVRSVSAVVRPRQTVKLPVIPAGNELIVMIVVAMHPVGKE